MAQPESDLSGGGLLNALTVDVEEHFQVSAFEDVVDRESWHRQPTRVRENTARLLDLFDEASVKATFFVLGWVAARHPEIVREIAGRGHEIGSHGQSHRLVYNQSAETFREETACSRSLLQDQSGQPVLGYRAASFSIGPGNVWALDVLAELGFRYDSSLFPVIHDRYGFPGAPRVIHRLTTPSGAQLVEVPPSTLPLGKATLPVAGGGYLRIFPLAFTRWSVRRLNVKEQMPAVVYLHPWEIDPEQPRIDGRWSSRFRHYTGLRSMVTKLRDLLGSFRFAPVREVISRAGFGLAEDVAPPTPAGPAVGHSA